MDAKQLLQLAQNLARLRQTRNITQSDVATAIGVSIGTVSRWETTGFNSIKLSDLLRYMEFLENRGVSLQVVEFKGFSASRRA